jgi:scyllo-inositol 2-dehydrogenase (NADP+)
MTNAALVGFGLAGRYFHTPLMQAAGIAIRAVVTRQRDAVLGVLPQATVLEDEAALWQRKDIDVVVIATPNHLHARQATAALHANMHVVVDKPLCLHSGEAGELIRLASSRERMLSAFQNRRWDADFLTIKRLIDSGRLGALNAFHARWDRFRPTVADRWREHAIAGNGVLYDLGAHLIDQALCLFGLPDWVQADVFAQRPGALAADGFELLLAKGAARVTLGVSTLAANSDSRYRVHGANGSYMKSGIDVQELQLRSGMLATDSAFGVEPQSQWGTFTDGTTSKAEVVASERGQWTEFYSHVRKCIEHHAPPPVPALEARDVIRVIEAAMDSSERGVRVRLG